MAVLSILLSLLSLFLTLLGVFYSEKSAELYTRNPTTPKMKRISTYISPVTAYLFILLFVYAAMSKLLEFGDFQTQLGQSPLLGAFAVPVSYGVIITELLISVLLAVEKTRKAALYMAFTLMVMFTAYIVIILNFTPFTPCSCGGVLESLGWTEHLIFNIAFILLAFLALLINSRKVHLKRIVGRQFALLIAGTGIVISLFAFSNQKSRHNNAFQRTYIPHGLEKVGTYDLSSNTYYIAGIDDSTVYLGNYMAPLYLKLIDRNLKSEREVRIEIENTDLPYKRVKIIVKPPYFYLADGTVPVIFRGSVKDWKAGIISHKDAYFLQYVILDTLNTAIAATSAETKSNVLGILHNDHGSVHLSLNGEILEKQLDGLFDTDGVLLDNSHGKAVYVYYYRNSYVVSDNRLGHTQTGKTIDTISRSMIDVAFYEKKDQYKLGGKSIMVNKYAAAYGDHLFINSDRLGKFEDDEVLRSAHIIDMYNMNKNAYLHSFYFYHDPNQKLLDLKAYKDLLFGITENRLWVYHLDKKYFE